jgi:copper(I)-binding protein
MRLKTVFVLLSAVLFFVVGEARADKSYQLKVTSAAKAGSVQLQPGDYHLVLDNSRILFRELETGKEFVVDAKIDDSAEKKFASTAIHSRQKEGATLITKIELGGTKTTVAFP